MMASFLAGQKFLCADDFLVFFSVRFSGLLVFQDVFLGKFSLFFSLLFFLDISLAIFSFVFKL